MLEDFPFRKNNSIQDSEVINPLQLLGNYVYNPL
jgi:hypothetical protein